jgi:Family of unknown function (DUF5681)
LHQFWRSALALRVITNILETKMNNDLDNNVGYGKPPKRTQFKPGQSGNPSGRPKGARNFRTDLLEELAEPITVKDDGRDVTVSKQRACIKTLVAAAIGGNARACEGLLAICAKFGADPEEDNRELEPDDREILDAFAVREGGRRGDK